MNELIHHHIVPFPVCEDLPLIDGSDFHISDDQLSASSSSCDPWLSRLDMAGQGGWCAGSNTLGQWIQVMP